MSGELVTIARFSEPLQAALARNDLQAAGIKSVLLDESFASTVWYLTTAVGGIRLQVAAEDAERAAAILRAQSHSRSDGKADTAGTPDEGPGHNPANAFQDESADEGDHESLDDEAGGSPDADDSEEEPQEELTRREQTADRAFRGAVLGLLMLPLQIYVFWLLLKVVASQARLSPQYRIRAWLAAGINIPLLVLFLVWLEWFLPS